jgi:multicomponent Na+:H+ antiporter subunit G
VTVQAIVPWIADGLIVLGMAVMTIGVVGVLRMPEIYTKLHAASKSVFLGVCAFLLAVVASGDPAIIARVVLIGMLLVFTTPVAAHEIARAAARELAARRDAGGEGVRADPKELGARS